MSVIVDARERDLISEIDDMNEMNEMNGIDVMKITVKQLDLGDIIITSECSTYRLLVERKTKSDLLASLKDGRYSEQKIRIKDQLNEGSISCACYLIEENKKDKVNEELCRSVLLSIALRDNITIIYSKNTYETAQWICTMRKKISNKKFMDQLNNNIGDNNSDKLICITPFAKRGKNINKDTLYIAQLMQIPGISEKVAIEFSKTYDNIIDFIKSIRNNPESIANIKISNRRFGMKRVQKIQLLYK